MMMAKILTALALMGSASADLVDMQSFSHVW